MPEQQKHYNPPESEARWAKHWLDHKTFAFKTKDQKKVYSIDTPPPTVSGNIHIGHVFSYSQTDFLARFWRMRGRNVFYPFGFDDNGLPTERFVEKQIGKRAVDMSREEFTKLCLKETVAAERKFEDLFKALGLSVDWSLVYRTVEPRVQKISQKSFIELFKKNRTYRFETPSLWCPECRTAVAQVELKDVEKESQFVHIKFSVDKHDLIIATTRPELLPACVAVLVNPEDSRYKKFIGKKATIPIFGQEVPIISDKLVEIEKGTGAVMCCTFGDQTDIEWYKAHRLPLRIAISPEGKMLEIAGKYAGFGIKDVRRHITKDLEAAGFVTDKKPLKHTANVHDRCDTPIEFLVTKQWYVKYLDLKDEFLKMGRKLKWHPEHMVHRYENWVNGLRWDWCISRQRYFGIPFPVWYCSKCGETMIAEERDLPVNPLRDKPTKPCPKCKSKEFDAEKDVMDTWATSSLTPQINARWGEKDNLMDKIFPMSLRPQGQEIISFWLFNTIIKSTIHQKELPWENAAISGYVMDPYGEKMSKSKGNVVLPEDILKKFPADAIRYWASTSRLGDDVAFKEQEIVRGQKLITKMWNASKLASSAFDSWEKKKPKKLEPIDLWLLTKMNHVVRQCTTDMENYEYAKARQAAEEFFWFTFCDFYLEMVKDRVYNKQNYSASSIQSAAYTAYQALLTSIKLLAPFTPFITEELYHEYFKKIEKVDSIHISEWPHSNFPEDENASHAGDLATLLISNIRTYKNKNQMPMSGELKKVIFEVENEKQATTLNSVVDVIKNTMKIQQTEIVKTGKKPSAEAVSGVDVKVE